jgi:hypothetical protein
MSTPPPAKKAPASFPILLLVILSALILGFSAQLGSSIMAIIGAGLLVAAFVILLVGRKNQQPKG